MQPCQGTGLCGQKAFGQDLPGVGPGLVLSVVPDSVSSGAGHGGLHLGARVGRGVDRRRALFLPEALESEFGQLGQEMIDDEVDPLVLMG